MSKRRRPTRRDAVLDSQIAQLRALYEQVPDIECKGLCHDSCHSWAMVVPEQRHIERTAGVRLPLRGALQPCPALSPDLHRCTVYQIRPLICRIWGTTQALACSEGCQPAGGWLTEKEAYELIAQAFEIAGQPAEAARLRAPFATPESAAVASAALRDFYEADRMLYDLRERRARADGTALYLIGRGRISAEVPRADPDATW